MAVIEIKVYHEAATIHVTGDTTFIWDFITWAEENSLDLREPNQVDFDGHHRRLDYDKRKQRYTSWNAFHTFWCLAPPDQALMTLIKMRWNDEAVLEL